MSGSSNTVERDPETLELFIEESIEALVRVEKHLLDAERGTPAADIMASLFRDFHTIKGTSGFLALDKIRSLSHAAEDLLARLRDKSLAQKPEHFSTLVIVVDQLRTMIETVKEKNDEGPTDVAPTVTRLQAHLAEAPADDAEAPLAANAPAQALPAAASPAAPAAPHGPEKANGPAATTAAEEGDAAHAKAEPADGTVRVSVGVLDRLMNLIGELVLARNQMMQIARVSRENAGHAQAAYQRLNVVTSDLQEQVMKTRMQPVARVFERIPRMVRDLCRQTQKQATTQIDGNATEIDRALVEAIRDPVMHIVRNAIDHGLETPAIRVANGKPPGGCISVRAAHEGGMVMIEIEDDGRGMDPAKLRAHAVKKGLLTEEDAARLSDREALDLVFRAGFSTAEKVTDISGRGVGMDVVRTHVERAGGQVELDSTVGKGTTIRLRMPLTLAIIPALLVEERGQRFAIPQVNLLELVRLSDEQTQRGLEHVRGAPIYRLRGEILPLVPLSRVLGLGESDTLARNIVVVSAGGRRYGLLVDHIRDTEEIVIKPLHGQLKRLSCYSGATVLGDGGVALILEVAGVAAMAGIDLGASRREHDKEPTVREDGQQQLMVFAAGDGTPCAVPLGMVARLETIDSATIERVGGNEWVQYRDHIMPIVRPEALLPVGQPSTQPERQPLIVFDFGTPVGMAVSSILDVTAAGAAKADAEDESVPYTLGKSVVFGRTTLLVDVYRLLRELAPESVRERRRERRRPRVLVADDSNAMRAALCGFLRSRGIEVVDVPGGEAALREVRSARAKPFDAVVTDLEMAGTDGFAVLESVQRERPELPVFVWTQHEDDEMISRALKSGAKACVNKMRREDLMQALLQNNVIFQRRADDSVAA